MRTIPPELKAEMDRRIARTRARYDGTAVGKAGFSIYGDDRERLEELAEALDVKQSAAIRIAIDWMHERVCRRGA